MSKLSKIKEKLKREPITKDFTWDELSYLLSALGYIKKRGAGLELNFIIKKLTAQYYSINHTQEMKLNQEP